LSLFFFTLCFLYHAHLPILHSFPTRRSSDLDLRNKLREMFKDTSLQDSIDKRYKLQTAHLTAIRFKESFDDAGNFISKIARLRDRNFGSCTVDQIELVGNDWYQQQEKVESIAKFSLSKQKVS